MQMGLVFFSWTSKKQNIIEINGYKVIQFVMKHMVYELLKNGKGIAEVKRENYLFEKSPLTLKSSSISVF